MSPQLAHDLLANLRLLQGDKNEATNRVYSN